MLVADLHELLRRRPSSLSSPAESPGLAIHPQHGQAEAEASPLAENTQPLDTLLAAASDGNQGKGKEKGKSKGHP